MKPLQGIVILDLSRVLAGPMATQLLAEMGATVIKVERPKVGDETRHWEPQLDSGDSGYFFAFNRGKKSITVNLKSAEGQDVIRGLAQKADILLENFLPGYMDAIGLGYDRLAETNSALVYISNTGFGQDGPYRDRSGYDTIFQALSGVMALTGYPDGPPAKVGVPFADLTSALWIAIAALTGIAGRHASGRGCHIDVAMLDIQVSLLTIAAARHFALGEDPARSGTEHPGRVPSAAFECLGGQWLHISCSDQHWTALCRELSLDQLASDRALDVNRGRLARREEIMASLSAAISKRDRASLADALRTAGVPAGEVNSVAEILDDPHIRARKMVGSFDHPTAGRFPALRTPLAFSGYEDPEIAAPPLLGADTDTVLCDYLGMDAAAIRALREAGAV